ncbi:hypothetical protein COU18_01555 [Candidatus Kaiserbacteria bacterium CG10_big_fil_rev_8_21_14_0_10_51_14]|uniref:TspO protein n=1 Tax=Candidatus Kaiserbacteria bacterium CG10_big_fil_rev_8_21_14_0_10_51_14 TaxID=1974610 RepID=A0A2H0UCC8_9BACT|nr:MAG: hypothetical protein COU18_01555 [Candidatus Kaiserbacteria bacterium CG10_big_fil_rev_8_21_14_0_10_51_14]
MGTLTKVSIAFIATFCAGLLGTLFVDSSTTSWYTTLIKPALNPPPVTFGVAWTVLYFLMALALSIVWVKKPLTSLAAGWVRFYFIQLLFNAAWTIFFFGFHSILVAFVDILFLGFMLLCLIIAAAEIDRRASYLLAPSLLWVLFAGYLNLSIWLLN